MDVVILTKAPFHSSTKSRLASEIGIEAASALACAFLADTLALCREAGASVSIAYTPAGARSWFEAAAPGVPCRLQACGSLGDRIRDALDWRVGEAGRALLIASDSPDLPPDTLTSAAGLLDRHEVVLGPARDGGFMLIGAKAPLNPGLFDGVRWSTEAVLGAVRANAIALDVSVGYTPPWADVDDFASLRALDERLLGSGRCVATRAALRDLGLCPPEALRV